MLRQTSLERLKTLCEEAATNPSKDSVTQRVGALYESAMDSVAIEQLAFTPIKAELERLNALTTKDQILNEIATQRIKGVSGILFGFVIDQDDKNVNAYIPQLRQSGLTLPDRDYYLKNDARSQTIRDAYLSYITGMFKLVGDDSVTAKAKANAIYVFGNRSCKRGAYQIVAKEVNLGNQHFKL